MEFWFRGQNLQIKFLGHSGDKSRQRNVLSLQQKVSPKILSRKFCAENFGVENFEKFEKSKKPILRWILLTSMRFMKNLIASLQPNMEFQENGSFLKIWNFFRNFFEIFYLMTVTWLIFMSRYINSYYMWYISWYKILFDDLEIINQHVNIWKRNLLRTYHAP